MSDKTFEWSLTGVTVLVIAWIVMGIITGLMHPFWVVIIGIVLELGIGGVLLRFWGKDYMERE